MNNELKELQDRIDRLDAEIERRRKAIASAVAKSLAPKTCEYCGCPDGIHRTDCPCMRTHNQNK